MLFLDTGEVCEIHLAACFAVWTCFVSSKGTGRRCNPAEDAIRCRTTTETGKRLRLLPVVGKQATANERRAIRGKVCGADLKPRTAGKWP